MMCLIMSEKITPGQSCSMYRVLTGDDSAADNHILKEIDDWMRIIIKVCTPAMLRGLCVNNRKTEGSFKKY